LAPVTPSTFIRRGVAYINTQQTMSTSATTPKKPANNSGFAPTSPAVSKIVASAPGPAMKGNASGNTEMSSRLLASSCSDVVERVPEGRANTMSSAIKNSRVPPAIRNAFRDIPMTSRNLAPTNANSTHIPNAITVALPAIFFLKRALAPCVRPANSGMSEIGSTTTKKTTKNLTSCSVTGDVAARKKDILRDGLIGS